MSKYPVELIFWIAGLSWLALINPAGDHFSLCLFHHLGISWCPGCGVGHAVSFALHGDWTASFRAHCMGIPALLIISHRILVLVRDIFYNNSVKNIKTPNHTYEQ